MLYFFPHTTEEQLLDTTDPNRVRVRREFLERFGLEWVWRDVTLQEHLSFQVRREGIGKQCQASGLLVVPYPQGQVAITHPRQEWHEIDSGRYWVGTDPQHPDTPERMLRKQLTNGYYFTAFEELSRLIIPIVRSPQPSQVTMRQSVYTDQQGKLHYKPKAADQWLWDGVGRAWDLIHKTGDDTAPGPLTIDNGGLQLAVDLLGVNYRYGRAEQQVLGWLDNQNWTEVLYLACDLPLIREVMQREEDKKKAALAAALSSSTAGDGAS